MIFGDVTSARPAISEWLRDRPKNGCEWGMSERLGMVEYGEHDDFVLLGRDISRSRLIARRRRRRIDREVKRLCDDSYQRAMKPSRTAKMF